MLNEEAIDKLNNESNKSQFIEDLILNGAVATKASPAEDYIIESLDHIKQLLTNLAEKPRGGGVNKEDSIVDKVSIPNLKNRPLPEIRNEIRELEAHRDKRLEYCQDPEEIESIGKAYQDQIDNLWAEYKDVEENL